MKKRIVWLSCILSVFLVPLLACSPTASPKTTPTKPTGTTSAAPTPTAASTTVPKPAPSSPSAQVSFAGKTINMVIPIAPASGADLMGRVYARYLSKFLPGNPTVVARSMPGAQATIGYNHVYSSKPDGLTVLVSSSTGQMSYILGISGVHYDLTKMDVIVGYASGTYFFTRPSVVKRAEDLPKAKGIIYGGGMSTAHFMFVALMKLMDVRLQTLSLAYGGSGDTRRAFLGGEINIALEGTGSYAVGIGPYVEKGEAVIMFQTGVLNAKGELVRDPGFALDVPTGKEVYERIYGKSPAGIAWDTVMAMAAIGPSFQDQLMLPPGVPDGVKRAYWDAAQKMLQDPEFRKTADVMVGANAPWSVGEALSARFKSSMKIDPKIIEWLEGALKEYGVVLRP
ncbi:MAG: hypothetical protein HYX90_10355 [Chloroflexi bacterium]|nr:hypothetical protein [Chloroflexota bacterium]